MENIQFRIQLFFGGSVDVNVSSKDIFAAADEIRQSIEAGDIKVDDIPINRRDVRGIEDIPG